MPQQIDRVRPVKGIVGQGLLNEVLRERGEDAFREGHDALDDVLLDGVLRIHLASERGAAHQKLEEEHADRPDVHAVVVLAARAAAENGIHAAGAQVARVEHRGALVALAEARPKPFHFCALLQVGFGGASQHLRRHVLHSAHAQDRDARSRVDGQAEVTQLDLPPFPGLEEQVLVIALAGPGAGQPAGLEGVPASLLGGGRRGRGGKGGRQRVGAVVSAAPARPAAAMAAHAAPALALGAADEALGELGFHRVSLHERNVLFAPGRQQDVLGLDVPVDDAVPVQVHQQAKQGLDHLHGAPPLVGIEAVERWPGPAGCRVAAGGRKVVLVVQRHRLDHALAQLPVQVAGDRLPLHQVVAARVLECREEGQREDAARVVSVDVNLAPHVAMVDVPHALLLVDLHHDHHFLVVELVPGVEAARAVALVPLPSLLRGKAEAAASLVGVQHLLELALPPPGRGPEHQSAEDLRDLASRKKLDGLEGLARPVVLDEGLDDIAGAIVRREGQAQRRHRCDLRLHRAGGSAIGSHRASERVCDRGRHPEEA
mmetsp:Transcript_817/g.1724  ORF Transcript_817/g.1724 Transcript_817/m.1724 type:complete len:544 (-) Transcript_817:375-2006(-)